MLSENLNLYLNLIKMKVRLEANLRIILTLIEQRVVKSEIGRKDLMVN
jgi:hypothetical protein